jgi:hypothetical protein
MWNAVGAADRAKQTELNKELEQTLIAAKRFHAVLTVMRDIEPVVAQPEQIQNGGFESELPQPGANIFDWLIVARASVNATLDAHAHSGQKSLRVVFRAPRTLEKIPISQTVVVEPGASYRFEGYMRTEDLLSPSPPALVISGAADGSTLGTSKPAPSGTNAWQLITFDFKPLNDGITIGFYRAPCAEGQICPIFGTIWYDDFSIKRIDGSGSPRRNAGNAKR